MKNILICRSYLRTHDIHEPPSQVPGYRPEIPGDGSQIPVSRYPVPGPGDLVPVDCHPVPGHCHRVPGPLCQMGLVAKAGQSLSPVFTSSSSSSSSSVGLFLEVNSSYVGRRGDGHKQR